MSLPRFIPAAPVLLAAAAFAGAVSCARAAEPLPFHAFAWQLQELGRSTPWSPSPYEHLTHFYWLTQGDLEPDRAEASAAKLKAAMDQLPVGRRAVFDWDNTRLLWDDPADRLRTADGTEFHAPWWDHGAARLAERYGRFFRAYRDAGGELDVFVLDMEHGVGGSGVGGGQEHLLLDTREKWEAVLADPRAAQLREALGDVDAASLADRGSPAHKRWMAYAFWLTARYIEQALYEPARRQFPDVKFSNYGAFVDRLQTPRPNGTPADPGDVPGRYGTYAGTHQATDGLYGTLGGIKEDWAPAIQGKKVTSTPFNACLLHTNLMRTTILSEPTVRVTPWIAWRRYDGAGYFAPGNLPLGRTDYYQELIIHTALCNPDYFLFWSAFRWARDQRPDDACLVEDCLFTDRLLDEINRLVGFADRRSLVTALAPWHQGYLLSGMYADGRDVWRLTPDTALPEDKSRCLVEASPPTFDLGDARITFSGGRLETGRTLAPQGWWITTSTGAQPTVTKRPAAEP